MVRGAVFLVWPSLYAVRAGFNWGLDYLLMPLYGAAFFYAGILLTAWMVVRYLRQPRSQRALASPHAFLLLWLMPWAVFLPQTLREVPLTNFRELDRRKRSNLLFLLWALVILLFFSFSTRQEYYTIPALPAIALLGAVGLLGNL